MNEQQLERLLRNETDRRQREDDEHLRALAADLNADLPSWILRRRIIGSLVAITLLVVIPMGYSAILPSAGDSSLVACNLQGQEEAVIQCAHNLLT